MRNLLMPILLALLLAFSSGCKSANQSAGNPNNSNIPSASSSPATQTTPPNPTTAQQDPSQPGAATPNNATNIPVAMDSAGTSLSMLAMDFHGMLLQGDKAKLEPMLADDYKRTRLDGTVVNKTQELASLKKEEDMLSMEAQPAQIKGDTATVTGKVTLTSRDMSGKTKGSWQTTDTFRKRGEKWLVVSSVEKKN